MQHSDRIIINKIIKEIEFATNRLDGMNLDSFLEDIDAQHIFV